MIRVFYRGTLRPDQLAAFKEKLTFVTKAMRENAKGARGTVLLQNRESPNDYLVISHWDSFDEWRTFWSKLPKESADAFRDMFSASGPLTIETFQDVQTLLDDNVT